jgi:tetratricopeptide (TPR) repeat protein
MTLTKKFLKAEALAGVRKGGKGDVEAGIDKYREYLALEGNELDDDAWASLGGAYRRVGDLNQAIDCYAKAHEINPQSTYALVNLVSLHAARNTPADRMSLETELPEVIRLCYQMIERPDATFWNWYDLATVQLIQGPPEQAMRTLYHAVALTPPAAKENFRSVANNLRFLQERNPAIAGLADAIALVDQHAE